jgi:hypothetical protein
MYLPLGIKIPYEKFAGLSGYLLKDIIAIKLLIFYEGSIYLTVAIALERYTTVCHPFFKVRS